MKASKRQNELGRKEWVDEREIAHFKKLVSG